MLVQVADSAATLHASSLPPTGNEAIQMLVAGLELIQLKYACLFQQLHFAAANREP